MQMNMLAMQVGMFMLLLTAIVCTNGVSVD